MVLSGHSGLPNLPISTPNIWRNQLPNVLPRFWETQNKHLCSLCNCKLCVMKHLEDNFNKVTHCGHDWNCRAVEKNKGINNDHHIHPLIEGNTESPRDKSHQNIHNIPYITPTPAPPKNTFHKDDN